MKDKMKAMVLLGDMKVEVREVPRPKPGKGEVLVGIKASGICGSDLKGGYRMRPEQLKDKVLIAGHEGSGVVEELGEGIEHIKVGDRVSIYHMESCGHCIHCLQGYFLRCKQTRGMGSIKCQGSFADYKVTPERNCMLLPDELSFIDGAFIACGAQTTFSALRKIGVSGLDKMVVFGLGPIGLVGVTMGVAMGARVVGVGRRSIRLKLAKEYGAAEVVDIDKEDPLKFLQEKYPMGFNAAYETCGADKAREQMLQLLTHDGRVAVVSGGGIIPNLLIGKEITVRGSAIMPRGMYGDLSKFLIEHKIDLQKMVTHSFPIEKADEAFRVANSKECGKVVVEWN